MSPGPGIVKGVQVSEWALKMYTACKKTASSSDIMRLRNSCVDSWRDGSGNRRAETRAETCEAGFFNERPND